LFFGNCSFILVLGKFCQSLHQFSLCANEIASLVALEIYELILFAIRIEGPC